MKVQIALLACLFLLAGCTSGDKDEPARQLTQEEADVVAEQSIEALAEDLATPGAGDLQGMTGSMEFEDEMASGNIDMDLQWGSEGTSSASLKVKTSGITIEFEFWCGTDKQVIHFDGQYYEGRLAPDCSDMLSGGEDIGLDSLDASALEGLTKMSTTPNSDGTVTASYKDETGQVLTFTVDTKGRITTFAMSGDAGDGQFTLSYGTPTLIVPPAATERMPSSVAGYCYYLNGESCTFEAEDGDDAPFSDFEVRIYPLYHDEDDAMIVALPLTPGSATAGAYTITVLDNGNGKFGAGDSFTIEGPEADIVVFDLWAQKDIDETIPGFEFVFLVAALALVALRRR